MIKTDDRGNLICPATFGHGECYRPPSPKDVFMIDQHAWGYSVPFIAAGASDENI